MTATIHRERVPGARRREGAPGFTLIELLVVVAILAVVLTLGKVAMDYLLPDAKLSTATRRLASFIEDARDTAIVTGRPVYLEYSLGDGPEDPQLYRSFLEPVPGQEDDFEAQEFDLTLTGWTPLPEGVRIDSLVVAEDEEVQRGLYSLLAYPDGTMSPHVLRVHGLENDAWYSVQVNGLLGEAQVYDYKVTPQFLSEDTF